MKYCCYQLVRSYAPFKVAYIGIGDALRPYSHGQLAEKNQHYNRILQRIFDKARRLGFNSLNVVIIRQGLDWDTACQLEREQISLYGRLDRSTGCLANLTNGGDGTSGYVPTPAHREKVRRSLIGIKRSEETKAKIGIASRSRVTQEYRENIRGKLKEFFETHDNPFLGKKHTEETCQLISLKRIGQPAWKKGLKTGHPAHNKGKPLSEEQRAKFQATIAARRVAAS